MQQPFSLVKSFFSRFAVVSSASASRVVYYALRLFGFQLLMQLLGVQNYALFMVLISLESFFLHFDFGLGLAYQNQLSKSHVQKLDINEWANAVFRLAFFFFVFVGLGLVLLYSKTSSLLFAHLNHHGQPVLQLGYFVIFWYLLYAIGNIGYKVLFAKHMGHLVYIIQMIAGICSFCLLVFFSFTTHKTHSLWFALGAWVIPPAICAISVFAFFFYKEIHYKPIAWALYRQVLSIAFRFFLFNFLTIGVVYVDYLVMTQTLSAQDIASYSVIQKYFSAVFFLFWATLLATWPKCSEFLHAKQATLAWKHARKLMAQGFCWMLLGGVSFVIFQPTIIRLFGGQIYPLSFSIIALFVFYFCVRVITDSFQMLLQSVNDTMVTLCMLPMQVVLSIFLQYKCSQLFGLQGILWGLIGSFVLTASWIVPLRFYMIKKRYS